MMNDNPTPNTPLAEKFRLENETFLAKTEAALIRLFEAAKNKNELHFALSLTPEFRGIQGPGFNSADECFAAIKDYTDFINSAPESRLRIRVALAFYCHLAEASGFYEIPKNMLRIAEGKNHNLWPFREIVESHKITGQAIAPNANKIMKDLAGHCSQAGFPDLAEIFKNLFDSDLRNGFAHADYVVWPDGIRLTKRNGGLPEIVSYERFSFLFNRGVNFFAVLQNVRTKFVSMYNPPRTFRGRLANSPEADCTVSFEDGALKITVG